METITTASGGMNAAEFPTRKNLLDDYFIRIHQDGMSHFHIEITRSKVV